MRRSFSQTGCIALILGYSFLYAPLLFLIFFSFNASSLPGVWSGFSWKWYRLLLENETIFQALINSLWIASFAATGAVILGTAAALRSYYKPSQESLRSTLFTIPLMMPEVITGLSLLLFFLEIYSLCGWPAQGSVWTVVIGHTTLAMSYVYILIRSRLKEMDISLEEAALNLGAPPLQVILKITLPLISPALVSGWFLAFGLSLDDVVLASFLSGPGSTTLPLIIFSSIRMGISPEINALSTLMIICAGLCIIVSGWIGIPGTSRKTESHNK